MVAEIDDLGLPRLVAGGTSMEREQALEGLIAACQRDAGALARLGLQQLDDGQEVVRHLLGIKMSFDDILERIINATELRNGLLVFLIESVTDREARNRLIEAVVEVDGLPLRPFAETVAGLFGSGEDLQYIFRHFRPLVTDTNHYLFAHLSADRLWHDRVVWQLAKSKPDHVRAVDEFWRAFKGFPIFNDRRAGSRGEYSDRCYRASIQCLKKLIRMIYGSMLEARRVPPLAEAPSVAATPTKVGSAMSLLMDHREMDSRTRAQVFLIDKWVRGHKAHARQRKQRARMVAQHTKRRSS